jgi:excisionase family DNA binding protein
MSQYSTGLSKDERRKPRRTRTHQPPAPEALLVTIKQTERLLGLSYVTIYALIRAGKLTVVRIGGRTLIDHASVKELARTGCAAIAE